MTKKKSEQGKASPLNIKLFQSRAQQVADSKARIMRVNGHSTNTALHTAVLVPASVPKKAKPVRSYARQRNSDEATAPGSSIWDRGHYRTGDGEVGTPQRPNSCHKHIKSFGTQT